MKILLAAEALHAAGGIAVSVDALRGRLEALGHEAWVGLEERHEGMPFDLVWTHGWQTGEAQRRLDSVLARSSARLWSQVHDYKDLCLTGRKAVGAEMETCNLAFSPRCFAVHAMRGCGRGKNPVRLVARYRNVGRRLETVRGATKVLVFSKVVERQLLINGVAPDRVHLTPPWLTPFGGSAQGAPETRQLLWVGRMTPEKGAELFLRLLHELKRAGGPPFTAKLVGDGPERGALERLANELGLTAEAQFAGWLPRERLAREYAESNQLVMTSRWPEPFGLVGPEAMEAGLPVLALRSGGAGEWCREEFGLLAVEDLMAPASIARVRQLLDDRGARARCSSLARAEFQRSYSAEAQNIALRALLAGLGARP